MLLMLLVQQSQDVVTGGRRPLVPAQHGGHLIRKLDPIPIQVPFPDPAPGRLDGHHEAVLGIGLHAPGAHALKQQQAGQADPQSQRSQENPALIDHLFEGGEAGQAGPTRNQQQAGVADRRGGQAERIAVDLAGDRGSRFGGLGQGVNALAEGGTDQGAGRRVGTRKDGSVAGDQGRRGPALDFQMIIDGDQGRDRQGLADALDRDDAIFRCALPGRPVLARDLRPRERA